jgi:hypothetical protein
MSDTSVSLLFDDKETEFSYKGKFNYHSSEEADIEVDASVQVQYANKLFGYKL